MALTVSDKGGGDFQQAPVGAHAARCIKIIDIGTQHSEFQGKPTVREQVIITWELPNELMDDGRPFTVSKYYTASLHEKATLRHDLESWRGRAFSEEELTGFSLKNILGKPCMLSIVDKEGKSRVGGVMALPKGTVVPPQINPSVVFDISEWDDKVFNSLSEKIKETIMQCDEVKKTKKDRSPTPDTAVADDFLNDDIPFN